MSHRSKFFFEIFPALQVQFAAHENLQMTWLWTDGSSMSYSPGWINNMSQEIYFIGVRSLAALVTNSLKLTD